jgi:hypothetical protein
MEQYNVDDATVEQKLVHLFPGVTTVVVSDLVEGSLLRQQMV